MTKDAVSGMQRLSLPGTEDQTTTAFPATPAWTKGTRRANIQNPLGHQSHRRRPRDLEGRLANKSYNGAFLSGPKWFVCHGGLGTLLLHYLREWRKGPVSPAWTSQEIYFCVAKGGLDKSRGNQPRPR